MKLLELRDFIAAHTDGWHVTIDEAEMMNVDMDALGENCGAIYVEEFVNGRTTYGMGASTVTKYEITFVVFSDIEPSAVSRQECREERIEPVARELMKAINAEYNVKTFAFDTFPKGFDAAEVTFNITFELEERTAC